jgi:alpha-beta hydrolase superfamily lysophospholipase
MFIFYFFCVGLSSFLANNGFRCFVLDNRGHGHSQHKPTPGSPPFLYEDWITDARMAIKFVGTLPSKADSKTYKSELISTNNHDGEHSTTVVGSNEEKHKIFVLGHSAGCVSLMCALSERQVEKDYVRGLIFMSIMYPKRDLFHLASFLTALSTILIFRKFPARLLGK